MPEIDDGWAKLMAIGVAQQKDMLSDAAALDHAFATGAMDEYIAAELAEESAPVDVEETGGTEGL